jgi:hypothetical protein
MVGTPSPRHERLFKGEARWPRAMRRRQSHRSDMDVSIELLDRPLSQPPSPHKRRPWDIIEPPTWLVAQAEPPVRRNQGSRGGYRLTPPPRPSGHLPAASKCPNRALVNPRPSPATFPAKTTGELAGILPAAPPPWPRDHIARSQKLLRVWTQTEGMVVRL